MNTISEAVHWWVSERPNLNITIRELLSLVFNTLNYLYETVQRLPNDYSPQNGSIIGEKNWFYVLRTDYESYKNIRLSLAFISDLYFALKTLMKQENLMEIQQHIALLEQEARCFDKIRNFFTHMDDRLFDLDKHGVWGSGDIDGIKYQDSKGNFYLHIANGIVYFSANGKLNKTILTKNAFLPIFDTARKLYSEIITHKIHSQSMNYPTANTMYVFHNHDDPIIDSEKIHRDEL